jgi:hypothetical protein
MSMGGLQNQTERKKLISRCATHSLAMRAKWILYSYLLTPQQLADRFERFDAITNHLGDGDQWCTEQQAPNTP